MTNARRGFLLKAAAVQDALDAAIAAELVASGETTPHSVGYPAGGVQAEHIWIAGKFDADLPRYVSGGLQRDEATEIEVRILVRMTTEDMSDPRDRAFLLSGIVENAVSTDPSLAGAVDEAHVAGGRGEEGIPEEHAREYGIAMRVAYQTTAVLI